MQDNPFFIEKNFKKAKQIMKQSCIFTSQLLDL